MVRNYVQTTPRICKKHGIYLCVCGQLIMTNIVQSRENRDSLNSQLKTLTTKPMIVDSYAIIR